jgi:hypothetical protein
MCGELLYSTAFDYTIMSWVCQPARLTCMVFDCQIDALSQPPPFWSLTTD